MDEAVRCRWKGLGISMLAFLQVTTFDNWALRVEEAARVTPWAYCILLAFLAVASMGVLNLLTGVIIHSAFIMITVERSDKHDAKLERTREAVMHARYKHSC